MALSKYLLLISAGLLSLFLLDQCSTSTAESMKVVDQNGDGIWDSVEPFIKKHSKTDEQRRALEYEFKAFQEVLLDPHIGVLIKEESKARSELSRDDLDVILRTGETIDTMWKASACVSKVFRQNNTIDATEMETAILINRARIRAYSTFNKNLSGGSFTLWDEDFRGDPCSGM